MRLRRKRTATPTIVTDQGLASNTAFIRWLAFGLIADDDRFSETVDWVVRCQDAWRELDDGRWDSLPAGEQDERLHDLHVAIVRDALAPAPAQYPCTMGVTGGYDSRGIACLVDELGLDPVMYVHGQPGMYDFDCVRLIDPVGRIRLIDVSTFVWDYDKVVAAMRGRQNLHISPGTLIGPMLDDVLGSPRIRVTGFLNGSLMRDHGTVAMSPRVAAERFAARNNPLDLQSLLPRDRTMALVPEPLASAAVPPLMQLEFGLRQFQRFRAGDTVDRTIVLPYEDPRWVGFWLSRSSADLRGKARWVEYLRRRYSPWFPDLADFSGGAAAKAHSRAWVSERRDAASVAARIDAPTTTMCWVAGYRDNESFRAFVDDSFARLRANGVFAEPALDDALNRLRAGEPGARARARGFVSTQIALDNGVFDEP